VQSHLLREEPNNLSAKKEKNLADFFDLLVSVSESGCIYGLVALAFLVIIKPTGIVNFCIGEWSMLGGLIGVSWVVQAALPYGVALPATVISCALVAYAIERLFVRPLVERAAPMLSPVLVLLGLMIVTRETAGWIYGISNIFAPPPFGFTPIAIGPFHAAPQTMLIVAMTLTIFLSAWIFFEKTLWGKAFQAVAINRFAAGLMGINLGRVTALSFAASGAIAGLAGLLESPQTSAYYLVGLPLAVKGFSALVIGGVGKVEGALYGGLLLAFAENFTVRYLPIPSGVALGMPLLLIILFLILRPTGLVGNEGEAR
jgi:branched-chain amino acid transport system permease protein